jgi:hypothetical protein
MALHLLDSDTIRISCRHRIESCELWLRRLIHDQLLPEHGSNYVQNAKINGQAVFNQNIRKHTESRTRENPGRYPREIDTLMLDHLSTIICKEDMYKKYFIDFFAEGFPCGSEQLRETLNRLIPIRNALSHANPLSLCDAERALCYSSDIIGALESHYATLGMETEYNAPTFTKFSDSAGNVVYINDSQQTLDYSGTNDRTLRCGDSIRLEVEIDSHYQPDDYSVLWQICNLSQQGEGDRANGSSFSITLEPRHVGTKFSITVTLTSNKPWHRHSSFDAIIFLWYKILPPL